MMSWTSYTSQLSSTDLPLVLPTVSVVQKCAAFDGWVFCFIAGFHSGWWLVDDNMYGWMVVKNDSGEQLHKKLFPTSGNMES
jgi:hypothetical protein